MALILHCDEVTILEDKINALIKAAGVNVKHLPPGPLQRPWPQSVYMGSLMGNVGAGGPVPAAGAISAASPAPSTTAAPAEKKMEAKKVESEESDDDMGFDLFD
ncbi:60S acidic ribosomal protein P1-like [Mustela erminea]|uniref:60S acidic ribosomal protein P1-like n=1 Tax=Mustela erminea TaxID=36723 RepID=UPI0013868907|nr:60S acidic ribosomal protein P1-like [Mustela erminea]